MFFDTVIQQTCPHPAFALKRAALQDLDPEALHPEQSALFPMPQYWRNGRSVFPRGRTAASRKSQIGWHRRMHEVEPFRGDDFRNRNS